jgi:myb proto-oncogene protein
MDAISILANACADPSILTSIDRPSSSNDGPLRIETEFLGSESNTNTPMKSTSRGNWTAEEDDLLRAAVQQYGGRNWKKISDQIPERTDVQCLHRWQKVLRPGLVKGPWTPEVGCWSMTVANCVVTAYHVDTYYCAVPQEDKNVIDLVAKFGVKSWSFIARQLQGRLGKQCRER